MTQKLSVFLDAREEFIHLEVGSPDSANQDALNGLNEETDD